MNYHNITTDDMLNGDGLRTVLWVSGCGHHCKCCQNSQTWDPYSGIPFDQDAETELISKLSPDYISGLTLSGGDPLHGANINKVIALCNKVKRIYPEKTIWIYTGWTWNQIYHLTPLWNNVDVLVDGRFMEDLADTSYEWAGSRNQQVIDVQRTLREGKVILWRT